MATTEMPKGYHYEAACVTPYDSFAILPYQVIFTLALWVLACILQEVVGRRSEKFRSMSDAKRRNMVCYMIELIVTPICLASTLYYWRFLFLFTPLHVEDAKVCGTILSLLLSLFMIELIYRVKTPLPLIVHHLMAVGYFILFAFALYDTSYSARSIMSTINSDPSTVSTNSRVLVLTKEFYLYARLATLQALHATCEPLDYLGLILYRFGKFKPAAWCFRVGSVISCVVKAVVFVVSVYLYFIQVIYFETKWGMIMKCALPPLLVGIVFTQAWAIRLQWKLASVAEKKEAQGDEASDKGTEDEDSEVDP